MLSDISIPQTSVVMTDRPDSTSYSWAKDHPGFNRGDTLGSLASIDTARSSATRRHGVASCDTNSELEGDEDQKSRVGLDTGGEGGGNGSFRWTVEALRDFVSYVESRLTPDDSVNMAIGKGASETYVKVSSLVDILNGARGVQLPMDASASNQTSALIPSDQARSRARILTEEQQSAFTVDNVRLNMQRALLGLGCQTVVKSCAPVVGRVLKSVASSVMGPVASTALTVGTSLASTASGLW